MKKHLFKQLLDRAMKLVTDSQYEHAQVAVDLFHQNVTLVHCSVAVRIHFSYLKECMVSSEFGSTVSCGLAREPRLA